MEPVSAILAAIPLILQVQDGLTFVFNLLATLKNNGTLTDEQVFDIRQRADLADAMYDQALADAKSRLA